MKRVIALTFMSMLFFNFHSPVGILEDAEGVYYSDISDPPIIGFDEYNGVFIDTNSTLSGFIVSSVYPDSAEWYVSDLSTSGELSAITEPLPLYTEEIFSNQDDGLSRWSWNISNIFNAPILGTEVVNDCTCYLTIIVISGIHQSTKSLAVFLGDSDSPGITLDSETERLSGSFDTSGWASSPTGEPIPSSITISNELSSTGRCSTVPDLSLHNADTNI